jgi:hypothetical protein
MGPLGMVTGAKLVAHFATNYLIARAAPSRAQNPIRFSYRQLQSMAQMPRPCCLAPIMGRSPSLLTQGRPWPLGMRVPRGLFVSVSILATSTTWLYHPPHEGSRALSIARTSRHPARLGGSRPYQCSDETKYARPWTGWCRLAALPARKTSQRISGLSKPSSRRRASTPIGRDR